MGCYAREYTNAHLAANPGQVVDTMVMRLSQRTVDTQPAADMAVVLAHQGHVGGTIAAGRIVDQALTCHDANGQTTCAVECDGGSFVVTRDDGDVLEITTSYLQLGTEGDCGGVVDLAEKPGTATTYRLNRVAGSWCERWISR